MGVQSLLGKLGSCMLCTMSKKIINNQIKLNQKLKDGCHFTASSVVPFIPSDIIIQSFGLAHLVIYCFT